MIPPHIAFWRNLRDLPSAVNLSAFVTGFIITLVGYTGPLLIVLQAAQNAGLSPELTSSWVWAVAVGNGVTTCFMSLWYRQPLFAPWSTAGAALLVTSLMDYPYPQAIGAYIIAGAAVAFLGMSGLFGRAMKLIPQPVVLGMLAGILLRFGLNLFTALGTETVLAAVMLATYFVLKRLHFRAPIFGVVIAGMLIIGIQGQLNIQAVPVALTIPHVTLPEFDLTAILNLALPLFILAITSQYAPGQAVLQGAGYVPPINGILVMTGVASIISGFFGGHGLTLGALTAAMMTNPDAHPDPHKRYSAGVMTGLWYILFGLFGTTVVSLFAAFPAALVTVLAGLALSATIMSALSNGLSQPDQRDGALMAFLCAGSGMTLFGIGAPFWALVVGVIVNIVLNGRKKVKVQLP
jgi:benzoate membrane transport protein